MSCDLYPLHVRLLKPDDNFEELSALIFEGIRHAVPPNGSKYRERYIQWSCSVDMKDMQSLWETYMDQSTVPTRQGNFWLIVEQTPTKEIIRGCVGLECKDEETAELRRMSVSTALRRQGWGQQLIDNYLEPFARSEGYKKIKLSTLKSMTAATSLYEKSGFKPMFEKEVGKFDDDKSEVLAVYLEKQL